MSDLYIGKFNMLFRFLQEESGSFYSNCKTSRGVK